MRLDYGLKLSIAGFNKVKQYIRQEAKNAETRMTPFGFFILLASIPYYIINAELLIHNSFDNLILRIINSALGLFLILRHYWPKKLRLFLPYYWYFNLLYSLPFFITYMLLKNNFSAAWILNELGVVVLMMLLVDWLSYTIILILGILAAWLLYLFTTQHVLSFEPGTLGYSDIINTFAISIVMGVIFSRGREKIEEEKFKTMKLLSANIAHELRTPLAAISTSTKGIKEYLPDLITAYETAKKASLPINDILPSQYKALPVALENIEAETNFANLIVNMLLVNVSQENIRLTDFETCSIAYCINEALRRYPLSPEETDLIHWQNDSDFVFYGKELFTIHIIFNLLKNSLYYIKAAGKGNIQIWLKHTLKRNKLYFRDTGKGISANLLPHIFDRFFTNTYHGTGVGLAFCKMVMQAYGGDIICRSIENEYTEFILSFPVIPGKNN